MNPGNIYIVRIGAELDLYDMDSLTSNVICKIFKTDEFSEEDPRERYALVLKPMLDLLPVGLKDINYFVMYNAGGVWAVFNIEDITEPRSIEKIESLTGLTLRTQL